MVVYGAKYKETNSDTLHKSVQYPLKLFHIVLRNCYFQCVYVAHISKVELGHSYGVFTLRNNSITFETLVCLLPGIGTKRLSGLGA